MRTIAGAILLLIGVSGVSLASVPNAPEIDAGAGVMALALLSGGLLILRARRKR
jgi:hypothetical protein